MARKAACKSLGALDAIDDVAAIMAISKKRPPLDGGGRVGNTTAPATREDRNEIKRDPRLNTESFVEAIGKFRRQRAATEHGSKIRRSAKDERRIKAAHRIMNLNCYELRFSR